ncbi:MAG TPA: heme exporter protein CcmB [Puia sp.]|nr:heme exporter protein CcmB [Puia sp.]
MARKILALLKKDILLEIRQQYSLYGIFLYVSSTIFVLFLDLGQPEESVWKGLFWMMQLFICVNAIAKSFLQETRGRLLYFYSIISAPHFILAKLLFNGMLMLVMNLLALLLFMLLLGIPLQNPLLFAAISSFGGVSLSLVFTFLGAIATRAQQNAALMAILGFPLIIPQLLLLIRLSNIAFSSVVQGSLTFIFLLVAAFDLLIVILAIILFPFLWKD